jgi:hypothetical protein
LNHEAKVKVAGRLADELKRSYGRNVLAILLDGSVARCEDTEYSDLELRIVTGKRLRMRNMSGDGYVEFVYRDLAIQLQFLEEKEVHKSISHPSVYWPLEAGAFLEPQLIKATPDAGRVVAGFRKSYDALTPESFGPAVQLSLVWNWQMYGKVRSAIVRKSDDLGWWVQAFAHDIARSIALINMRYLHHYYSDSRCSAELRELPYLPKNFASLSGELEKPAGIVEAAPRMWASVLSFAEDRGYLMKTHGTWDESISSLGFR